MMMLGKFHAWVINKNLTIYISREQLKFPAEYIYQLNYMQNIY